MYTLAPTVYRARILKPFGRTAEPDPLDDFWHTPGLVNPGFTPGQFDRGSKLRVYTGGLRGGTVEGGQLSYWLFTFHVSHFYWLLQIGLFIYIFLDRVLITIPDLKDIS